MLTYRQLHAKKIGPQHPLRVIAHCDVDAAYAQFEQVRLKISPEKPLAVQQWRGLIAVNYPARKFGITRHLDFDEAKKMCPNLICVHVATYAQGDSETEAKYHENPKPETHKVSLDPYRRESVKILKIFSESCPTIEKASIDEAFLDFSIPVREILCTRYSFPTLEALQDSSSNISLDDPLPEPPHLDLQDLLEASQSSNIIPLDSESDHQTINTWTDIALLIGAELMARCRQKVFDELGYTCSAGIATNKMLAKLCSAYKKPNAQTVLRPAVVRDFLRPFDVSKIRFLGGKLGQSVADLISTSDSKACVLSEVWKIPLAQLQNSLGEETGMWVWETVRGVDRSEVETKTHVKSMMSSKNFRPSITTWTQGLHWLRILARDLFARLNEARDTAPGIWPKSIVMHKRDGSHNSFAKQIAFPFTTQLTDDYIFALGQKLLQEFAVRLPDQSFQLGTITSLALAFQTLERIEAGQRGIQGFFAPKKLTQVVPLINSLNTPNTVPSNDSLNTPSTVASNDSLNRPNTIPNPSQQTRPSQTSAISPSTPSSSRRPKIIQSLSSTSLAKPKVGIPKSPANNKPKKGTLDGYIDPMDRSIPSPSKPNKDAPSESLSARLDPSSLSFVCPRCQEVISIDPELEHQVDNDREEQRMQFERLKNVHLDHHFAHDLWAQEHVPLQTTSSTNSPQSSSSSHRVRPNISKPSQNKNSLGSGSRSLAPSSVSLNPRSQPPPPTLQNRGIKDFFKPLPDLRNNQTHSKPKKRKK